MLVIRRKDQECLLIFTPQGEMIEVKLIRDGPNIIRLGVEAPKTFPIWRKELYEQLVQEGQINEGEPGRPTSIS